MLFADLPQLSSIEPIVFDEASQKLVARGDALFEFDTVKVRADQITFYKKYGLLDASGNINFTTKNHRLLSDDFAYGVDSQSFSINKIKYGHWPYFISAKSGGGSFDSISLNKAIFYYGEPNRFSPNISANEIIINHNDDAKGVSFKKVVFKLGNIPVLYIPKLKYSMTTNPFLLASELGYSGDYGTYFKSLLLLPLSDWFKFGLNLDFYSERGWLGGPAAQYYRKGENHSIKGAISYAAINDDGVLGLDFRNQAIAPERYYTLVQHKQTYGENLSLSFQVNDLSDSEIIRDFKEDIYLTNLFPLSYLETNYFIDQFALGSFVHFKNDDYSRVRQRLPELSVTYLASNILDSEFYHKGKVAFSEINEDTLNTSFNTGSSTLKYHNFDASYSAGRTFIYKDRLRIKPRAQVRFTNFSLISDYNSSLNQFDQDYGFILYGLDFESEFEALYPTANSIWGINGLRHLFKPSLSFTNISSLNTEDPNFTPIFQNTSLAIPFTDLDNHRDIESVDELLMTRLSFKNFFQTRLPQYGSSNLMEFHLNADFYHRYASNHSGVIPLNKNALWAEYALNPAPWIKLQLSSRFKIEDADLNENRMRLTLLDAERWQVGMSTYYIQDSVDQISLDYYLKLNEKTRLSSLIRANLLESEVSRFRIGIDTTSNSSWITTYALNYRKDLRRENKLSFDLRFKLLPY